MGDSGGVQGVGNGALGSHDHVIGGGEHRVHPVNQGAGGGYDFGSVVAGLFQVGDALGVQVCLGLGNGGLGVDFGAGVQ